MREFLFALFLLLLSVAAQSAVIGRGKDFNNGEPYMFGFRTSTQHRKETRASDGTIMGEYGHQTADGWYITVVYGTNEKGKYMVMERRKEPAAEARRGKSLEEPPPEPMGQYSFEYTSFNMARDKKHHHEENGHADGSKMGSYWWDSADGFRHVVTYVADDGGFMPMHSKFMVL